eukprot:234268-Chlamydomonas_euryale.AAC.1
MGQPAGDLRGRSSRKGPPAAGTRLRWGRGGTGPAQVQEDGPDSRMFASGHPLTPLASIRLTAKLTAKLTHPAITQAWPRSLSVPGTSL